MSILLDKQTRILIQGITGRQARLHARYHLEYGADIVCGVTPGRGGEVVDGIPVFDTVAAAKAACAIDASLLLIPPLAVRDAAIEAIENDIPLVVIITEHVPIQDAMYIGELARARNCTVIGPNTIGVISPGKSKIGVMPGFLYKEGSVGIVSRSGTLTHEIASCLSIKGIGQSTCVGIGGDMMPGSSFEDILECFAQDAETTCVILVGEIGGTAEEQVAKYLAGRRFPKPVVGFIAGRYAPKEKQMGHAGAIIEGQAGSAQSKIETLRGAGVTVCETLEGVYAAVAKILSPETTPQN